MYVLKIWWDEVQFKLYSVIVEMYLIKEVQLHVLHKIIIIILYNQQTQFATVKLLIDVVKYWKIIQISLQMIKTKSYFTWH